MKVLSLWQPWATLMAIGAKRYETRDWSTEVRGELGLHAALKWNAALRDLALTEPFRTALAEGWHAFSPVKKDLGLPLGAMVGALHVTDCRPITDQFAVSGNERAFGDYRPGRYAHLTRDAVCIDPIPFKGKQGFFNIDDALIRPALEKARAA